MEPDQSPPEQAPTEPAPTQDAPPSLQLADLVSVVKLIQVVAQRGAIRADEMAEVGKLHDTLLKFLVASGVVQPTTSQENQKND